MRRRPRQQPTRAACVVRSLASVALIGALCTACSGTDAAQPAPPDTVTQAAAAAPRNASDDQLRDVRSLVDERNAALARADLSGWLAGATDPVAVRRLTQTYRNLQAIGVGPVTTRSVTLSGLPAGGSKSTGGFQVEVESAVAITGFDRTPRVFRTRLTVAPTPPTSPVPPATTPTAGPTPQSTSPSSAVRLVLLDSEPVERPQPWDLPDLKVRRSPTALVLAAGASASPTRLEDLTARAATARTHVAQVWGDAAPAVWVMPGSDADAAALLGRSTSDLGGVAAVTDGPLVAGTTAGADRIVVIPNAWTGLSPDGRDVVMAHELTHATIRRETTTAVPMWLSEGFADDVGYRSVNRPQRELLGDLIASLERDGVPPALPDSAAYGTIGEPKRLADTYGQGWVAVQVLVDRLGVAGTVAFYREVANAPTTTDPDQSVETALRKRGYSMDALVRDWRERLNGLLRG